ncbi:AAA family ATPase [Nocardioides sp. NPDC058538]|uniref:AAA family ATPase n=1 Tax=Nocardioides sp. NPDC058538 TaxID=3346542 RepID=UPI003659861F
MKLNRLYVRFFRSLNIDYLRKYAPEPANDPWDVVGPDDQYYPFVRLDLENDITTIVGANEAGKTQVLTAIECLLTGTGFVEEDFCRYSVWFAEDDGPRLPEFGGRFTDLTPGETETLKAIADWADPELTSFHLFRFHDRNVVYVGDECAAVDDLSSLGLPRAFSINAKVPLPDSVEIAYLASSEGAASRTRVSWLERMLFVRNNPTALVAAPQGQARPTFTGSDSEPTSETLAQWELAKRLLTEVADVTPHDFKQLSAAVQSSDAYAEALVAKMNRKVADSLNFRKWWTQDSEFALQLKLRDFDLVFTIRDRTGTDYTFRERSQGLKYFLSYFVQYLSHGDKRDEEILLMDEPDAYLSNSGQQDLLRIFNAFADPEDGRDPVQVIYVTHSPFLIDKNHAERVRVLEKGDGEEGTRVVKNAGRNHFEPLRTALGGFVGETTFIGTCNLLVEGQADPILLAGASNVARKVDPLGHALDLNTLTVVACGGAQNVPYMAYLSRGRDEDKPAVMVLVDNDSDGVGAIAKIKANKGLVPEGLVFTVADLPDGGSRSVAELEDLIPTDLANEAVLKVAAQVLASADAEKLAANWKAVEPKAGHKLFKLLEEAAKAASDAAGLTRALEIPKVAFARAVVDLAQEGKPSAEVVREYYDSFAPLIELVNTKQREANRLQAGAKVSTIIKRLRKGFIDDHPEDIRKNAVTGLLETLIAQLPDDPLSDAALDKIRGIQRDFKLSEEPRSLVDDPNALREALMNLSYAPTHAVQDEDKSSGA